MTSLRQLQTRLQRHILTRDLSIERAVTGDDRLSARDRLGVYAHAYIARLVEALQDTCPALARVLGEDQFAALARDYAHGHPSRSASIRYFGRRLPDFLAARAADDTGVMLADLASWEWCLGAAFDGPDAEPMAVNALGDVPAPHWPAIQFRMPGSMQRARLRSNAVDWWRFAVQEGVEPQGALVTNHTDWVIWRAGLKTNFRSLAEDEACMLDEALRGRCFAELCAELADRGNADDAALRAATLVRGWCIAGWITGLELQK